MRKFRPLTAEHFYGEKSLPCVLHTKSSNTITLSFCQISFQFPLHCPHLSPPAPHTCYDSCLTNLFKNLPKAFKIHVELENRKTFNIFKSCMKMSLYVLKKKLQSHVEGNSIMIRRL